MWNEGAVFREFGESGADRVGRSEMFKHAGRSHTTLVDMGDGAKGGIFGRSRGPIQVREVALDAASAEFGLGSGAFNAKSDEFGVVCYPSSDLGSRF